jgi:hypothetical protein
MTLSADRCLLAVYESYKAQDPQSRFGGGAVYIYRLADAKIFLRADGGGFDTKQWPDIWCDDHFRRPIWWHDGYLDGEPKIRVLPWPFFLETVELELQKMSFIEGTSEDGVYTLILKTQSQAFSWKLSSI